jgi:hypothetical protein
MTKLTKRLLATGVAASMALPFMALAQVDIDTDTQQLPSEFNLPGDQTDLRGAIINVIQYILGFLGLIAVIIILYGGFLWMTAAGNEEKVGKAKQTITAGLIGLIIILSAWAIAAFVITALQEQVFNQST